MAGYSERECPLCHKVKRFRNDNKSCGCRGTNPTRGGQQPAATHGEPPPYLAEKSTQTGDKWEISLPKTRIHTLEELLEYAQVDTLVWEVERFIVNKWEVGAADHIAGKVNVEPLFQVKAFLRKRKQVIAVRAEIESLVEDARGRLPKPPKPLVPEDIATGRMLEINITDHHFGKLAWGLETLHENYDVKIASGLFQQALRTILARAGAQVTKYDEIWFVVGNDLLNADTTAGTTTAGTHVETDVRHEKTYATVRGLLVEAIEELRGHTSKVKVIVVPGNHDHNATWHMGDSLKLYFSRYADVEVDNQPSPRKYHTFGQTLIGYAHGDLGKLKDLPMLMAAEARDLFGKTRFHEWHTGHTHQTFTQETHGVRVRILPALCPPDAWHSEMGFVGNLRSSEAYLWDADEGLIGTVIFTDSDTDPVPPTAARTMGWNVYGSTIAKITSSRAKKKR